MRLRKSSDRQNDKTITTTMEEEDRWCSHSSRVSNRSTKTLNSKASKCNSSSNNTRLITWTGVPLHMRQACTSKPSSNSCSNTIHNSNMMIKRQWGHRRLVNTSKTTATTTRRWVSASSQRFVLTSMNSSRAIFRRVRKRVERMRLTMTRYYRRMMPRQLLWKKKSRRCRRSYLGRASAVTGG